MVEALLRTRANEEASEAEPRAVVPPVGGLWSQQWGGEGATAHPCHHRFVITSTEVNVQMMGVLGPISVTAVIHLTVF